MKLSGYVIFVPTMKLSYIAKSTDLTYITYMLEGPHLCEHTSAENAL